MTRKTTRKAQKRDRRRSKHFLSSSPFKKLSRVLLAFLVQSEVLLLFSCARKRAARETCVILCVALPNRRFEKYAVGSWSNFAKKKKKKFMHREKESSKILSNHTKLSSNFSTLFFPLLRKKLDLVCSSQQQTTTRSRLSLEDQNPHTKRTFYYQSLQQNDDDDVR